ncbi:uncharacterized protein F4822DRAFT_445829 [Hypoxylon trugodes]|uniref:uncharacterized protein n=1 Tax=Hypoxylon trugodes TaxID=326681 RepID=UPI00219CAB3E|nr:uncharacterized protein F4822DRAFT_445829 [Hypoxylon trugodes]KAI1384357.1 hypothetical protein F4822DRAFT_445829 [Hypoxylon trugodes]
MKRLKNLLRRRSYNEDDVVPSDKVANRARTSQVRRSYEPPQNSRNNRPTKGDKQARRNENKSKPDTNTHNAPATSNSNHHIGGKAKLKRSPHRTAGEHENSCFRDSHASNAIATGKKSRDLPIEIPGQHLSGPSISSAKKSYEPDVPKNDRINTPTEEISEDNADERSFRTAKEEISDCTHTEDIDENVSYASVVTHETVHPQVHEILEEQIHRDVHNHDVYHRIQPVYDVEFLPARHFVPGPSGDLVEVSENDLPGCTGPNQRWYLDKILPNPQPESAVMDEANESPVDPELLGPLDSKDNNDHGFKTIYNDSWKASAARAF